MRDSISGNYDIGEIDHAQVLRQGDTQSIIFTEKCSPPVFDPDAPKFHQINPGTDVTYNLTAIELRELLEEKGLNSD